MFTQFEFLRVVNKLKEKADSPAHIYGNLFAGLLNSYSLPVAWQAGFPEWPGPEPYQYWLPSFCWSYIRIALIPFSILAFG